jgi:NAD(P)-dependent dehydrogenase (short-subunit alcohol dehydrogenase family)
MALQIDLAGKIVLITGVSSGIGAGIARMYAKANASIAGCALEPVGHPAVRAFAESVKAESGQEPLYVQTDVTKPAEVDNLVGQTVAYWGGLDLLASNAGANVFRGAAACSREDWLYNLNLNLESHWNVARACKPYLEKDGQGVIVINSSCHAFNTLPGCFPYNIAKTGLKGLVQSLALEWSPAIRTVGVAPGFIDTPLNEKYFNSFPNPAAERLKTTNRIPVKRLGTPEDIGAWFVFLSSEYASFAAGQTFLIDGGASAAMAEE